MSSFEANLIDSSNEEELRFNYSASLRIFGNDLDFDLINNTFNIQPTHMHKKGEYYKLNSKNVREPFDNDMWLFSATVSEEKCFDEHIQSLWNVFKTHKEFLLKLKEKYTVDLFCGYRSNCDNTGFEISPESLEIFIELKIPFGVSIIIC